MSVASIRSEGDLEVALLHEAHSVLADIIGPELFSVGGTQPEQSVVFHTSSCFNLFLILISEFFAEGPRSAFIDENYQNWSLLKGLGWFCTIHPDEATATDLDLAVSNLEGWATKEVPFRFWCPDVNIHVEFMLRNDQLISFGANTAKHHLLRLAGLLGKLETLCAQAGYNFSSQELYAVLTSMIEEVRSRLLYHSSYLLELLGNVFLALNAIVKNRFAANPTNRVSEMTMPLGITSDVFRDLFGSVLVFKRYEEHRIRAYTPITTRYLKLRY
jgi:hypothetical protein